MGTLVNIVSIIIGGSIGLFFKRLFNEQRQNSIMEIIGLAIAFIGLCGALKSALVVDPLSLEISDNGGLMVLCSLVIGLIIGEYFDFDQKLSNIGKFVERKFNLKGFVLGFVNASLIFCVGAMAIIGAINDGVLNDPSVLYLKSAIDFVTAIMLCSTLGFGVIFSAISVGLYQGILTILATLVKDVLSISLLNNICLIGYLLVMVIGLNFLKVTKIKVANLLPAMLIPIIGELIMWVFAYIR